MNKILAKMQPTEDEKRGISSSVGRLFQSEFLLPEGCFEISFEFFVFRFVSSNYQNY